MSWRAALAALALAAEACANAPASLPGPSSMATDYMDIPAERCSPPLHGIYLSYAGGAALLEREDAERRACAHRVNELERDRDLALAQAKANESDRTWAAVGKVGTAVAVVVTIISVVFGVRELARTTAMQEER